MFSFVQGSLNIINADCPYDELRGKNLPFTEGVLFESAICVASVRSLFYRAWCIAWRLVDWRIGRFFDRTALMTEIARFSSSIRIWAIIAAIGGTFDTVYSFERGLLNGETKDIFKQFLLILTAMGGAQTGALLINWLTQEHV